MGHDTRITFVVQDLIYEFVRDELPVFAAEVLFFQIKKIATAKP